MIKVRFYFNANSEIECLVVEKITREINVTFFELIKPTLIESIKKINGGIPINSRYKAKLTPDYIGYPHLEVEVITSLTEYAC
jgi:hypothetical protein